MQFKSLRPSTFFAALLCLLLVLNGCTKGGGDGDGSPNSGDDSGPIGNRSFNTDCGTLSNGELKNPIEEKNGEAVTVTAVATSNAVIIERASGPQLVKLVGLRDNTSSFQQSRARSILEGLLGSAIFFEAEEDCAVTVSGGGRGIAGSLFTRAGGQSFAERLLNEGVAEADTSSACSGNLLNACYRALADENRVVAGATISYFLWKPISDSDGRLVVLFNPGGATVTVNGEVLQNRGASNGRGTTARGSRTGCAYGANVQISATDSAGRPLVWPGQSLSYTIPNGCDRVEF